MKIASEVGDTLLIMKNLKIVVYLVIIAICLFILGLITK